MVRQPSDLLCDALSVSGILLDNMRNIQMWNGQNKCKIWLQNFGFSHVQFVLPLDFQVKNANLCLAIPGKNTYKNILLVSCHFLRKKHFLDTTG